MRDNAVAGWGARSGDVTMKTVLAELLLFSCVGTLFIGIMLTVASAIG